MLFVVSRSIRMRRMCVCKYLCLLLQVSMMCVCACDMCNLYIDTCMWITVVYACGPVVVAAVAGVEDEVPLHHRVKERELLRARFPKHRRLALRSTTKSASRGTQPLFCPPLRIE